MWNKQWVQMIWDMEKTISPPTHKQWWLLKASPNLVPLPSLPSPSFYSLTEVIRALMFTRSTPLCYKEFTLNSFNSQSNGDSCSGAKGETQDLIHVRCVLYHWSYIFGPWPSFNTCSLLSFISLYFLSLLPKNPVFLTASWLFQVSYYSTLSFLQEVHSVSV